MHTKPAKTNPKGVAIVKNSMVELNKIILDSAVKNGINSYCLPPTDFMNGNKSIKSKILIINDIAKSGLTPITFGDALWFGGGKSYILSGDTIMTIIAKILKPRLSLFVLDVDGVYSDLKTKKLIHDFKKEKPVIQSIKMDVTGGMTRKITEANNIVKTGLKVFFVNGNKPKRITNAISGKKFEGTLFRK
jgi:isopentenyl phosphate kinase